MPCDIQQLGKFRNGRPKFWCARHYEMLGSVDGQAPIYCSRVGTPAISDDDRCMINPDEWEGGIGIWGALEPVYDTSKVPHEDFGVHVHARNDPRGAKQIDRSFKEVLIAAPSEDLFGLQTSILLNTEIACAYTASMVFGMTMKYLLCSHCRKPHIDAGVYAVTPHRKHLCTYCGKEFVDVDTGIANPVVEVQRLFRPRMENQSIALVDRVLDIKQSDYPGGLQIWGSNPAIVWTANRQEEAGIHVHLYDVGGNEVQQDETFGTVRIDGLVLDDTQVRCLMVQKSLPHLRGRIQAIDCPGCGVPHFDIRTLGVQPHNEHECAVCAMQFETPRKIVSNPIVAVLRQLKHNVESQQK